MRETRSDGELLRAIAADGDRRAFEELYRRYAPWLTACLRGRCADVGVVDDVVQETFLAVWRGTARYHEEGDAAGWLWRIGSRRLVDALRGDGARGRLRRTLWQQRWWHPCCPQWVDALRRVADPRWDGAHERWALILVVAALVGAWSCVEPLRSWRPAALAHR